MESFEYKGYAVALDANREINGWKFIFSINGKGAVYIPGDPYPSKAAALAAGRVTAEAEVDQLIRERGDIDPM